MRKIFLFIIFFMIFLVNISNSYAFLFDMDRKTFEAMLTSKNPKVKGVYSPFWWEKATLQDVQAEFKNKKSINSPDKEGNTALIEAIKAKKDIEILRYLVSNGADVNYKTPKGKSVIEFALNDKATLGFLIKSGAKVNPRILADNFPICENHEVLRLLLANGADINAYGEFGETPLQRIISYAKFDTIITLLDLGANVLVNNEFGDTVLMEAVFNEDPKITQLLLQRGAVQIINSGNERYGDTALIKAAGKGNIKIVKMLVEHGAKVNLKNNMEETPLMSAVEYPEILQFLISKGADINAVSLNGDTAYTLAVQKAELYENIPGYQKSADILKNSKKNNINARNKDGKTPLIAAFTKPDKLKQLIKQGADVNFPDLNGRTPLMTAVYPVQHESIKILLEAGANPNLHSKDGKTALMIHIDKPETIELLIKYKADVNAQDKFDRTPLWYVTVFNKLDVFKVLIKHKANPNIIDKRDSTVLMAAAVNGRIEMVKMLLENGAAKTINVKDNKGKTALDYAKDKRIADLLKKYGAK